MTVTYLISSSFLEGLLFEVLCSRIAVILAHHCLRVGTSWDNHSCVCASTCHSLVLHDVLRVILTKTSF